MLLAVVCIMHMCNFNCFFGSSPVASVLDLFKADLINGPSLEAKSGKRFLCSFPGLSQAKISGVRHQPTQ